MIDGALYQKYPYINYSIQGGGMVADPVICFAKAVDTTEKV